MKASVEPPGAIRQRQVGTFQVERKIEALPAGRPRTASWVSDEVFLQMPA